MINPLRVNSPATVEYHKELRRERIAEAQRLDPKAFDAWVKAQAERLATR